MGNGGRARAGIELLIGAWTPPVGAGAGAGAEPLIGT